MGKIKFYRNDKGIGDLLKSDFVEKNLIERADKIASSAGEGFEVTSGPSFLGDRASATVFATTVKASLENARNHTLMRALDAGGG